MTDHHERFQPREHTGKKAPPRGKRAIVANFAHRSGPSGEICAETASSRRWITQAGLRLNKHYLEAVARDLHGGSIGTRVNGAADGLDAPGCGVRRVAGADPHRHEHAGGEG